MYLEEIIEDVQFESDKFEAKWVFFMLSRIFAYSVSITGQ